MSPEDLQTAWEDWLALEHPEDADRLEFCVLHLEDAFKAGAAYMRSWIFRGGEAMSQGAGQSRGTMSATPLPDVERVEKLATDILLAIGANYLRGPVHRDRVYEALNALAFVLAVTLQGVDDPHAKEFFDLALLKNRNPLRDPPE